MTLPAHTDTVESSPRVFHPRRSTPGDVVRPTRAEISLPNLRHNLAMLQRRTEGALWCVLKADAYGHGAKACARTLERAGARGICVALLEEGIELRNAGIALPILVMGGYYSRAYGELLEHQLTPVLCEVEQIEGLAEEVRFRGMGRYPVHIKVDTGMARLGFSRPQWGAAAEALRSAPELDFEGLMTHFAAPDDTAVLEEQLSRFETATQQLAALGQRPKYRHAANTGALLRHPQSHFDAVRPGLGIFGIEPSRGLAPDLKPVMRVVSTVIALRRLLPGEPVGYGGTWRAPRPSTIATIPIGYADGLSRLSSNSGHVLVQGQKAPIVGVVSMDMTTIDVTDIPSATVGDEVVVIGSQRSASAAGEFVTILASDLAEQQGTIPWEIVTHVSRRVPRFYGGA